MFNLSTVGSIGGLTNGDWRVEKRTLESVMTMKRVVISFLCIPLLAASAKKMQGEGEFEEIKGLKDDNNGVVSFKVAMKTRSDSVSSAAFGYAMKKSAAVPAENVANMVAEYAETEGRFHRAVGLASYHKNVQGIVDALVEKRNFPLAASLLHFTAKRHHVEMGIAQKKDDLKVFFSEAYGGAVTKGKGKKGKGGGKKISVAEGFFGVRDSGVVERAILAAAYVRDKNLKSSIDAVEPASSGIFAAKLLYAAMIGATVDASMVQKAAGKLMAVKRPVTRVSSELSTWNISSPPACILIEALGETKSADHLPVIHKALFHSDIRVQVEAARAIKKIGSPESIPVLAKSLGVCQWPVLIDVCDAIGMMPDKRVIKPLISRLGKERGRFRQDVVYALGSIAGAQEGRTVREWVEWYKAHGENFEVDPEVTKEFRSTRWVTKMSVPSYGFFYGLSIFSDRFCFVVDTSASMRGGRIKSLRENMTQTLNALKGTPQYNIVDFGGDVITMYPGELTEDRVVGLKRVAEMPLTGATRSYDAMERAASLNEVDTLIFLSDGAPIRGALDSWAHVHSALAMKNYYRPLAFLSIDFDPQPGNLQNMRWLALLNAGDHLSVEIPLD